MHVGKFAKFCGGCSRSLDTVRVIYRPSKGSYPEPRPKCCSGKCVETVVIAYQARLSRRAAALRPHHAYNSNR